MRFSTQKWLAGVIYVAVGLLFAPIAQASEGAAETFDSSPHDKTGSLEQIEQLMAEYRSVLADESAHRAPIRRRHCCQKPNFPMGWGFWEDESPLTENSCGSGCGSGNVHSGLSDAPEAFGSWTTAGAVAAGSGSDS